MKEGVVPAFYDGLDCLVYMIKKQQEEIVELKEALEQGDKT